MKEYTIIDKITIDRPILFLCGPYYNKRDVGDRRGLLKNKINEIYDKKFLPLIIDDFLTEDNIKDDKISIQLMEEICAAISLQTYIFLDTLSASAELGIFSNSAYMNQLKIFIPKENDIYNKKNVGYFVKEVALKSQCEKTRVYEYRPRVRRNALATDYIVEFYSFVNDTIPSNILDIITNDPLLNGKDVHYIRIENKNERPQSPYDVCYTVEDRKLIIRTSIKLLFYATLAIVFCEYTDFFKKKKDDFENIDINKIEELVKTAYVNLIKCKSYFNAEQTEEIILSTVLKNEYNEKLIYHIVKFLHVFNNYSDYNREILFKDPNGKIISQIEKGKYISDVLPITEKQYDLIENISNCSSKYFEKIKIKKGKKTRDIVKYRDDDNGNLARDLHRYILNCFEKRYNSSEYSYAYQKRKSIKLCVEKHIEGTGFIKYDIKSFFNSITCNQAVDCIVKEFNIHSRYQDQLNVIMSSCFFEGELPLGFVSSPIISDICLKEFDNRFVERFYQCGIVYTRYADDILISSANGITNDLQEEIHKWIVSELAKVGFQINERKMQYFNFDAKHSFIRYLGVNIVNAEKGNILSVGKSYIYDTAKDYISYDQKRKAVNNDETVLFYERMRIIGKIAFIKQIEGEQGIARLRKRLFSYCKEIDLGGI